MTTLTVRKLETWVLQRLRERGAARGVSMEQEARDVLAATLGLPTSTGFDRSGLNLPEGEHLPGEQDAAEGAREA